MAEAATGIPYDPTPTEETTSITKVGGTRLDKFLAKIAGEDVDITPKTETERRLNEIAQKDSGSGGVFVVTFSGATDDNTAACDKTWEEIEKAYNAGCTIITRYVYNSALYYLNTRIMFDGLIFRPDRTNAIIGCRGDLALCIVDDGGPQISNTYSCIILGNGTILVRTWSA